MTCKWDRDRETYLNDGEPCKVDDYGDPTYHCQGRGCSSHIGRDDLTCPRCIARARQDIRAIVLRSAELLPEAIEAGSVLTEAANLAGPAADVEAWSWRKIAAKQGVAWHVSLIEDDDERHPYSVLTRWEFMLREDYGQPRDDATSITSAADYLERVLPKMAQDPEQDWLLFVREIRKCRSHIEGVLRDSLTPEKGAPCPDCKDEGHLIRMNREYPHWCEDADCERFHYSVMVDPITREVVPDTTGDWWICPRDQAHNRPHADYEEWVDARLEARKGAAS